MKIGRVIVVGCGGIGSHFTIPVCSMLGRSVDYVLIDGDAYEAKNIERQMCCASDVGRSKAAVLRERIHRQLGIASTERASYIHGDEEFAGIMAKDSLALGDSITVVAICVDNDATRKLIYDGVRMTKVNTIVVDMANEERHGDVILWAWVDKENVYPYPPDRFPNLKSPKDRPPGASCQKEVAAGNTQLVPTNMMAAAIGVWYVHTLNKRLTENSDGTTVDVPSQIMFDWKAEQIAWRM